MDHQRLLTLLVAATLAVLVPAIALARDDGLQREAQRRGQLFAEALNAPPERHRDFIADLFDPAVVRSVGLDRLAGQFARLSNTYAPLSEVVCEVAVFGLGADARAVLHVFAKDADGQWRDFQIRQQTAPPYALTEVAFIADVTEPIALPNGAITSPDTVLWLRNYVGALAARHELSCSVLITGPEGVLLEMQTGFADAARTAPITPDTRFGTASIGKMLTALAIGRLVDQGRLSFDDPLSKFIADFPDPAFAEACTIRNLLSHTSGVPESWTSQYAAEKPMFRSLAEYLPFIYRREIQFQPGQSFQYSNSNYILLGLIIESVTGEDYFQAVQHRVLDPLGMTDTAFIADAASTATPLEGDAGDWRPVEPQPRPDGVLQCSSAGGAMSTARDLLTLAQTVRDSVLLTPQTTQAMLASAVPGGSGSDWGMGFQRTIQGGVESFGHGGMAPGALGEVRVFPDEGVVVVLLSNQNVPAFDDLRRITFKLVTGER